MIVFAALASAGLLLSIIVHSATFFGIDPQAEWSGVWLLHIGVFAVFLPAVYVSRESSAKNFWKASLRFVPVWIKAMCGIFFAYAFFNFFFTAFVLNEGGVPAEIDGRKVLHNHGKIISQLTEEEYRQHRAYEVRTFSGHWMVFYGISAAILYGHWKSKRVDRDGDGA